MNGPGTVPYGFGRVFFPKTIMIPISLRVRLYWLESKSGIACRGFHRESNLMFTLRSEKNSLLAVYLLSVNEP